MSQATNKETQATRGLPFRPAHRNTLEKLCALRPDLAPQVWARFDVGGFPKDEAERLIAGAIEARKPKMHNATSVAERTHRQIEEQLRARHAEEAEQLRRMEERQKEAARQRYQQILDHWVESQRSAEAFERQLRRNLDPVGYGHWNPEPSHGYRD